MKISKLFHWLYALLMLLPFMFFIPSVLYYAFNDNATMQSVEVPKTETIAVDFNQLVSDVSYSGTFGTITYNNSYVVADLENDTNTEQGFSVSNVIDFYAYNTYVLRVMPTSAYDNFPLDFQVFINYAPYGYPTTYLNRNSVLFNYNASAETKVWFQVPNGTYHFEGYINVFNLTQMFGIGNEPTLELFNQMFPDDNYSYSESDLMQVTYSTGEVQQLVQNTDIINYAWESIWKLPLFNWTKVTFVSVPFAYITGLFGIGANSSFNYLFGYFATISICWLVFDVIMYVPMLVHRWIDKARLE